MHKLGMKRRLYTDQKNRIYGFLQEDSQCDEQEMVSPL